MRRFHWAGLLVTVCVIVITTQAYAGLICTTNHKAIVARTGKLSEMTDLMAEHEEVQALKCCIECLIESGTKVMITDQGFLSHTVRVLSGPSTGCEGDISVDRVSGCDIPGGR